jgi:hypothetical protein
MLTYAALCQVQEDVRALHRITKSLRARRFAAGSVAIRQPKVYEPSSN